MKNEGDIRLSIKQARKLHVLEEVTGGVITNREASAALGLSVRQVQRIKTGYEEAGASSLVHGNTGRKPSNFIPTDIRALVAERAVGLWKGASASHMSKLDPPRNLRGTTTPSVGCQKSRVSLHGAKKGPPA